MSFTEAGRLTVREAGWTIDYLERVQEEAESAGDGNESFRERRRSAAEASRRARGLEPV